MPDFSPHDAVEDDERLDELAQEFAERLRLGEQPTIDEYARRYPQWAAELTQMLPSVVALEQMRRQKLVGRGGSTAPAETAPKKLRRLGDYRIVREIGRGGMGIVYEAVQESLGRRVAVKVLPHNALLDPSKLDRFLREAQAAAALHHTNIVPVFGVGEADGLQYYVMQLIDGQGVDRLIAGLRASAECGDTRGPHDRTQVMPAMSSGVMPSCIGADTAADLPSDEMMPAPANKMLCGAQQNSPEYWRAVAEIGRQTADALQYAHEQGILHRDIKPANLLVDAQQCAWITDFGLAKLARQSDLTATGHIVGTLQYMAPECLKGEADARSDVYSLGLTLYELATLRPPVANSNAAQMFRQISESSPASPRQVNPAVPRDLETIILTATAHEPRHRYATAGELSADLVRFLEDRPIQARRTAAFERTWRWCRRNPVTAAWTATAVAALLLAGIVGWVGYATTTAALERESTKKSEADKATARADKNVALSLSAFEEIFNKLAPREDRPPLGINVPPRRPAPHEATEKVEADAAVLQSVLSFYEQFAAQNTTNPKLRLEAAKAHRHIGDIQDRLGNRDQSQAAYRHSVELLRQLDSEYPNSNVYRGELAQSCLLLQPTSDSSTDRRQLIDELTHILETLQLEAGQNQTVWQQERQAQLESKLAWELHQADELDAAEKLYRQAITDWLAVAKAKDHPRPGIELSTTEHALARLLGQSGKPDEARTLVDASIAELYPAPPPGRADDRPLPPPHVGELLASQYTTLAEILRMQGNEAEANTAERNAEKMQRSAHRPLPGRPEGGPNGRRPGPPGRPPRGEDDEPGDFGDGTRPPRGPEGRLRPPRPLDRQP